MATIVRGLYRIPGWAYATDGTTSFDIREELYRGDGYKPDYKNLPTKRAYEVAEKNAAERIIKAKEKGRG